MNAALLFFLAAQMRPFPSMSESMRPYASMSSGMGGDVGGPAVRIDAMPFARTVTCSGDYEVTGTAPGAGAVTWAASPDGASGACAGTTSWACIVAVAPNALGEGVETITITQGTLTATVDIGFYVDGAHSCFLAQDIDGSYNSTMTDLDAVATWINSGTSSLNVTQATGSTQPTYRTGIVGGQPVVRCDGGDRVSGAVIADWTFLNSGVDFTMEHVSATSAADPNALMLVISTAATVGGGSRGTTLAYDDRAASSRNNRQQHTISNGVAFPIAIVSPADGSMPAQKFNESHLQFHDDLGAGNDAFLYANGTLDIAGAASTTFSALDPVGPITFCASTSGASPFTGDLFRAAVYSSLLTATQLGINLAVDAWALGGTLPVTP